MSFAQYFPHFTHESSSLLMRDALFVGLSSFQSWQVYIWFALYMSFCTCVPYCWVFTVCHCWLKSFKILQNQLQYATCWKIPNILLNMNIQTFLTTMWPMAWLCRVSVTVSLTQFTWPRTLEEYCQFFFILQRIHERCTVLIKALFKCLYCSLIYTDI